MARKRKILSVRRAALSAAVAGVLLLGCVALYFLQTRRTATALRDRAIALEQREHWAKAASYWFRYTAFRPRDVQARIRLAKSYDESAGSRSRKSRAVDLYQHALGLAASSGDDAVRNRAKEMRLRLAELHLDLGEDENALRAAGELDDAFHRRRIRALALRSQFQSSRAESLLEDVRSEASAALKLEPGCVELAELLANVIHNHLVKLRVGDRDALIKEADEAMERLAAAAPNSVEARLARHRYFLRRDPEKAAVEISVAVQLAPRNPDVLLAAAGHAEKQSRWAEAEQRYQELIRE
ncbi:MAG: hypothetical protein N2C14_12100, partial [Planctomycetales bacterium]